MASLTLTHPGKSSVTQLNYRTILVQPPRYSIAIFQPQPVAFNSYKERNTVEPRFTNVSHHEQIGSRTKKSRVINGVSSNEHASRQQRLATSWEYQWDSVSCSVTFAQYTSLLEFAVPSLEFNCVLWFFLIYY
jgi:hypothetical protein